MRKVLTFTIIFTGTVLTVFLLNLMMYAMVPEYHDVIAAAVASSSDSRDIPVITPDMTKESKEDIFAKDLKYTTEIDEEPAPLSKDIAADKAISSSEKKPIAIDKEYHEDCGTGKGYWVITYSDGSVGIE